MGPEMGEVRMVLRGDSRTHRFLRARAMYMLEHNDPRSGFDDVGGALFWVSAQLTTVSSQMPNPVTTPGRVLDIFLSIWAITVAATLAASLAAFFHGRHMEQSAGG